MSQKIHLGGDKYAVVDQLWQDFGEIAKRGVVGGVIVELVPARPANPTICRRGEDFFYMDVHQEPINNPDHCSHISDPLWGPKARAFAEAVRDGQVKRAAGVLSGKRAEAVAKKGAPKPFHQRVDRKVATRLAQPSQAGVIVLGKDGAK